MGDLGSSFSDCAFESRELKRRGGVPFLPVRPPTLQIPALSRFNSRKFSNPHPGVPEEETSGDSLIWGITTRKGKSRAVREDTYSANFYRVEDGPVQVFGIYDGHGGCRAAVLASKKVPENFVSLYRDCGALGNALKQSFHQTDSEVLATVSRSLSKVASFRSNGSAGSPKCEAKRQGSASSWLEERSSIQDEEGRRLRRQPSWAEEHISSTAVARSANCGTTATIVVLADKNLHVAHVGDSRAILCRRDRVVRLCEDHRLSRADELERIERCGGVILKVSGSLRVNGVLSVSRSIGDASLKQFVISEPDVRSFELTNEDYFIVIASDGVWDHMVLGCIRWCT